MITWREVLADIADGVLTDVSYGNLDLSDPNSWDDYAHEWADGSQYVIYTGQARELWANSPEVQEYEDDAVAGMLADRGIDGAITACVYLALRTSIMDAIEHAAEGVSS